MAASFTLPTTPPQSQATQVSQQTSSGSEVATTALSTAPSVLPLMNTKTHGMRWSVFRTQLMSFLGSTNLWLGTVLSLGGLLVAVHYAQTGPALELARWTAQKDCREACVDDRSLGLATLNCNMTLAHALGPPPVKRASVPTPSTLWAWPTALGTAAAAFACFHTLVFILFHVRCRRRENKHVVDHYLQRHLGCNVCKSQRMGSSRPLHPSVSSTLGSATLDTPTLRRRVPFSSMHDRNPPITTATTPSEVTKLALASLPLLLDAAEHQDDVSLGAYRLASEDSQISGMHKSLRGELATVYDFLRHIVCNLLGDDEAPEKCLLPPEHEAWAPSAAEAFKHHLTDDQQLFQDNANIPLTAMDQIVVASPLTYADRVRRYCEPALCGSAGHTEQRALPRHARLLELCADAFDFKPASAKRIRLIRKEERLHENVQAIRMSASNLIRLFITTRIDPPLTGQRVTFRQPGKHGAVRLQMWMAMQIEGVHWVTRNNGFVTVNCVDRSFPGPAVGLLRSSVECETSNRVWDVSARYYFDVCQMAPERSHAIYVLVKEKGQPYTTSRVPLVSA